MTEPEQRRGEVLKDSESSWSSFPVTCPFPIYLLFLNSLFFHYVSGLVAGLLFIHSFTL